MATVKDLDARLSRLEAMAQEYIDRQEEGQRLTAGVERLADETGGLNAILSRVDEATSRIAKMETRVGTTDGDPDTTIEEDLINARKANLSRIYSTAVVALAVIGIIVLGAVNYATGKQATNSQFQKKLYDVCVSRNEQNQAIKDFLIQNAERSPDPVSQAGLKEFAAKFKITNCEGLLK